MAGGWSSLAFPGSSVLLSAQMTSVFSNFASLAFQESGAPVINSLNALGFNTFGHAQAQSGFASHGVSSFDAVNVASGYTAPGVGSFGAFNAASGFNLRGFPTSQLLQRVYFKDTTSRGSTSTVFSTYTVASITPISSLSTVLVRAGVYYGLANPNAGLEAEFASHLLRNPKVVPTSFVYLTNCSAPIISGNIGQPMGGAVAGGTGVAILEEISGLMAFEAVDSVTTLDPRQYGIDWATTSGTACIAGGYVTIEEWL